VKIIVSSFTLFILFLLVFTFSSFGVNTSQVLADYSESHSKLQYGYSYTYASSPAKVPDPNSLELQATAIYNDGEEKPFIYFSQIGAPWSDSDYSDKDVKSTIGVSGCGPTSLAMLVATLNPSLEITPRDVALYSMNNGYRVDDGSSYYLFTEGLPHYGLKYSTQSIDNDSIVNTLKMGHLVVMNVGSGKSPEDTRNVSNTWTNGGHFIVLRGVDSKGRILVGDPNSESNSNRSWDFNESIKPMSEGFCLNVWK
jgi:hypothetical protein